MAIGVVKGGFGVRLEGLDETLRTLRAAAPDLRKQLAKEIKGVGDEIVRDARALVPGKPPLSGWGYVPKDPTGWAQARGRTPSRGGAGFPTFVPSQVSAGIVAKTTRPKGAQFGALLYLLNKDAAGAILEVAGRKSDGTPGTAGPVFIDKLNDIDRASRVIWQAYDEKGRNKVQGALIRAVERAEDELQRRFGDEGFTETRR